MTILSGQKRTSCFTTQMKQLVTISSGSILVMIAFLDKVLRTRQWALLVAVHCGLLDLHYCELANDESHFLARRIGLPKGFSVN